MRQFFILKGVYDRKLRWVECSPISFLLQKSENSPLNIAPSHSYFFILRIFMNYSSMNPMT